jgi:hypothetical protein
MTNKQLIPNYERLNKPNTGRRGLLTYDIIDKACDIIEKGNFPQTACQSLGISNSNYYNYMKEGSQLPSDSIDIKRVFFDRISDSLATTEIYLTQELLKHKDSTWKPTGFMLEKLFNSKYGNKQQLEINVNPLEGLSAIIEQSKKELKVNKDNELESLSQIDTKVQVGSKKTIPEHEPED